MSDPLTSCPVALWSARVGRRRRTRNLYPPREDMLEVCAGIMTHLNLISSVLAHRSAVQGEPQRLPGWLTVACSPEPILWWFALRKAASSPTLLSAAVCLIDLLLAPAEPDHSRSTPSPRLPPSKQNIRAPAAFSCERLRCQLSGSNTLPVSLPEGRVRY